MKSFQSGKRDSNPRPSAWEANALPTELLPLMGAKLQHFPYISQGIRAELFFLSES